MDYVGNASKCLKEAEKLQYAYFTPELDNFENQEVTVDDILFKVSHELDMLDEGHIEFYASENDEYKYNTNRNKAWRKKCIAFLHKWASESNNVNHYKNIR